jgi:hypothetical protein
MQRVTTSWAFGGLLREFRVTQQYFARMLLKLM